jgi:tol-pal system protein YbgF
MWFRRVIVFGATPWLGCAHAPAPAPRNDSVTADLEHRLAESQAHEVELQRKVDELGNRVFILQDQLESRDVKAHEKSPPRLPVDVSADREEPGEVVEYAGAARDAHAPRPVLRLTGAQAPRSPEAVDNTPVATAGKPGPRAGRTPPREREEWRPPPAGDDRLPVTRYVPPVPKGAGRVEPAPMVAVARPPVAPRTTAQPAAVASSVGSASDAMKLYTTSVDLLHHGQHAEAIAGLHKFLGSYPAHDYADNAQYWLGECYYDQKDFKTALREFRRVVQRYPSGNKAPDALLKVGFCYWQLAEAGKARDVLEQVVKSYPGTEIARKATDKLQELK